MPTPPAEPRGLGCPSGSIIVRGVAWRKGVARRRGMVLRKALTALTKIEDEAPFHVGAAHQILGCLDRVDGLGAHFALFGA